MVPARPARRPRGSIDSATVSKASKRERQRLNREARREIEEKLAKRRRTVRSLRRTAIFGSPLLIVIIILAITNGGSSSSGITRTFSSAPKQTIDPTKGYTATIATSQGTIVVNLDAKDAPTSVNNFVFLARKRFYDGLLFNRASKDFVIQTGSPSNTTAGGPGYTVAGEVPTAPYKVGSVAWAKTGSDPNGAAGSQFFIGTGSQVTSLPMQYGIIGQVTSGLDVAQRIDSFAPASGDGTPTTKVRITKVTIDVTPTPTPTS